MMGQAAQGIGWHLAGALALALALTLALGAGTAASAVEISWGDEDAADLPPSGFELHTDAGGKPAVRRSGASVVLSCEPAKYCHLDAALPGSDGSDDAPLRVECTLAIDAGDAVVGAPLLLSLQWSSGAVVAVGLGDAGGDRSGSNWQNHVWTASVVAGKGQADGSGLGIWGGGAALHVRLVVASHSISAYASADGWTWTRINAWKREGDLEGAPLRVAVGRGWTGARPGLDNDVAGKGGPATYRIAHLGISSSGAKVPAELMKSYEKKDSREETLEQLQAAGLVRSWSILGPLEQKEGGYGIERDPPGIPLHPLGKLDWKTFVPGESPTDRILLLHVIAPGMGENSLRYAATTITAQEAHIERFLFDAERWDTLYLNGVELAQDWHDDQIQDDRLSATGWLEKGENRLLVRLGAGRNGVALLTLHHQRGDALYQIALLRRLAIDFPDDSEVNLQALQEIARLWEGLGFQREAARAYEDLARSADAGPEQIDAALMERTRLDRELGDEVRVASDVDELTRRWADAGDPASSQVKVARLWERMGMPDKAAAALAAASSLAGNDHQRLLDIALERACIHQGLQDPSALIGDLKAAVAALPPTDARHAELLVTLAQCEQRVGADAGALLTQALPAACPRDLRRIAALESARKDRAGEIAARERSSEVCPETLDSPGIALAQLRAAGGEFPAANQVLARAIERLPGSEAPEVQARLRQLPAKPEERYAELQGIAVEAMLRSSNEGRDLLSQVADINKTALNQLPSEIPSWHIVAPIPTGPNLWRLWDDGYLASVGIQGGHIDYAKPIEGLKWRVIDNSSFNNGILDLEGMFGGNNCVAILTADLAVDHDITTDLSMGSDDALRVYLNGKVVYYDQIQRGISPDSLHATVTFTKGVNHLVVMVQQGGGAWMLQFRIEGGTPVALMAAAVRAALGRDPSRHATAATLCGAADRLARDGHFAQAAAVVRTVLACYPDLPDLQLGLAWQFRGPAQNAGDGNLLMDLEDWCEASGLFLDPGRDGDRISQEWLCAEFMQGWTRNDRALDLLQATLRSNFRADWVAETLRRLGELYRVGGFSRLATATYNKALSLGQGDGGWRGAVQGALARSRPPKGQRGASDLSFEVNNQLRMAESAVTAKDLDRAIGGFQHTIEDLGSQLCLTADGRIRSVSSYAGDCLRGLDAQGQASYAARFEGRAQGALQQALAHRDIAACERIAATFPLTRAAAVALATAADGYAGRGSWGMAAGTWLKLLSEHTLDQGETATAAERLADAAARACDHRGLAAAEAALKGVSGSVPVDGREVELHAWLQGLEASFTPPAAPALPAALTAAAVASYPCPPDELYDMCRVGWLDGPQPIFAPCLVGDCVALTSLTGVRLIDLASGTTRWRDYPDFPPLRHACRWGGFAGAGECQACVADGAVFARVLRGGTCMIEARELASGELRWSTENGTLAAPGSSASSSPAAGAERIFACFVVNGQEELVALSVHDGQVLWQTVLSARRSSLVAQGGNDVPLDGYLAPPLVLGRQVLVAADLGSLVSVDAGTGAVDWTASYARGNFDPNEGAGPLAVLALRSPTRVFACGDDRLLIAPRDSLSILAFTRAGEPAWSREETTGRHISAISADGAVAISEWLCVDAINTSDGSLRWRFYPRQGDNQCIGHALIVGDEVLVPTDGGIYRLALADGAQRSRQSWASMGLSGGVATWLFATAHGLYGIGNNQLVCYTAAAAPPAQTPQPPPPPKPMGIERDADLPSAGLPPAPDGSPLAIDWRMGGDPVRQIDVPPGTPPGECFVRFDRAMALFDIPRHRILWRERLSADTRWVAYTPDLVLCMHYAGAVALDRATGAPRWTGEFSQNVMDGLRENGTQAMVWIGDHLMITARYWSNMVQVNSLNDGHLIGQYWVDGNPMAACECGGKVWMCVRRGDQLIIDERDPANLGAKVAIDGLLPCSDQDGASPDGGTIIAHNHTQAVRYDCATRKSRPFPLVGNIYHTYTDQDHRLAFVHGFNDQWVCAVLDPDDKVIFSEPTTGGGAPWENRGIFAFHMNGQHLVRFENNRSGGNHDGILGRSFPDGKEQWWVEGRENYNRIQNGMAMLGHYAIATSVDIEGTMRYREIDCDTGKEVAGAPIPGWSGESLVPMQVVGGEWLYGTDQGLVCMQPTTAAAAAHPPADGSIPVLPLASDLDVVVAPGEMAIDGHLDDWQEVEPVVLSVPVAARSGGGAALPLQAKATVRLCYDADGIYLAVEVAAPELHDPLHQASVFSGDGLVVALDPRNGNWRGNGQVVAGISLVDGETVLNIRGHPESFPATDRTHAHARAARSAGGVTYELMVPWSYLHGDGSKWSDHRLMAVDLTASFAVPGDQPRALELGWGLAGGWDPTTWRGAELISMADQAITGLAFSTCDGRCEWGPAGVLVGDQRREHPWMTDDLPPGVNPQGEDGFKKWSTDHPPPGAKRAHVAELCAGPHQHFFDGMQAQYVRSGQSAYVWVYLDPQHPPSEVMVQFLRNGSWEHRAYWGANNINWGQDGSTSRRNLGPLPKTGAWVRLEIPADAAALR